MPAWHQCAQAAEAGRAMRIGSLFSGGGGLDLADEHVFGGRVVWHCENDPAASKVLAHRWPGVPNLHDITTVDWTQVEPVDVLCGGFPCQDISSAGKQAGMGAGTRSGLWSDFARAIDALRPRWVVIENVRNLLSVKALRAVESATDGVGDGDSELVLRGLGAVLGDLADLRFDADWCCVSAAAVGACHLRGRVFIVAFPQEFGTVVAPSDDAEALVGTGVGAGDRDCAGDFAAGVRQLGGGAGRKWAVADTSRDGWHEGWPEPAGLVGRSDAVVGGAGPVELLPTPRGRDHKGATASRAGSSDYDIPSALLPTPTAQAAKHDADDRGPGTLVDFNLWSVAARISNETLLPTPSVSDGTGGHLLPGVVREFLPTHAASDASGGGRHPDARQGHTQQIIDTALLHGTPQWGKYEPAIRRWEQLTRQAPSM